VSTSSDWETSVYKRYQQYNKCKLEDMMPSYEDLEVVTEERKCDSDNEEDKDNDDKDKEKLRKEDDKYKGFTFLHKDILCLIQVKTIPKSWILLDSQSTVDVFNESYKNIWDRNNYNLTSNSFRNSINDKKKKRNNHHGIPKTIYKYFWRKRIQGMTCPRRWTICTHNNTNRNSRYHAKSHLS